MLLTCSVFIADAMKCSVNVVQRSVISVECNTPALPNEKAYHLQKTKSEAAVPGNSPGGYHTAVLNHIWYGSIQHKSLAVCQTGSVSLNLWRCLGIQRPSSFMIHRLLIYYIKRSVARVSHSLCMLGIWICAICPCGTVGFFSWIIPLKSLPIVRLQPANCSFYFHCFSKAEVTHFLWNPS